MSRRLGRGLDKLLGETPGAAEAAREVAVDQLRPGRGQPRRRFDKDELLALAESIRRQGVIQPIIARPGKTGFEIVAGERRWRAAQMAGIKTVPAVVREITDRQMIMFALVENLQRADLSATEQARGIHRMTEELGMTHEEAGRQLGLSRAAVTNLLRLLSLSAPVLQLLDEKKLDAGHARALLPLPARQQQEAARKIIAQGLSARAAESLAKKIGKGGGSKKPGSGKDADTRALESELSVALKTRVQIQGGKSGRMTIHYANLESLDRIIRKLKR